MDRIERLMGRNSTDEHGVAEQTLAAGTTTSRLSFIDVAPLVGVYDLVPGWGLSWNDFDGDGDHDLFVANHMHFPSEIYVNDGGLVFSTLVTDLGMEIGLDDHVGVWSDFDGDGDEDLYTANGFYRADRLMVNAGGGRFEEQSEARGLRFGSMGRGRSAIWQDFNGDGWVDLLVLNLLSPDFYYESRGSGRFEEVTVPRGLQNFLVKEGAVAGDFDGDGDSDLYYPLQRRHQRNTLLLNRGDGLFVDFSKSSGADLDGASYASALGDYDNDGDLDIYVARAGGEGDVLLRNRGDATFEDVSRRAGIELSGRGVRNAGFEDFDNDGHLDLYVTVGGTLDGANQPNVLFSNQGDGTFREAAESAGAAGARTGNSAAAAFGDFDLDGRIDIAVTNGAGAVAISGPHQLLRNTSGSRFGEQTHWLRVLPRRTSGSRLGRGAQVRLRLPDGHRRMRVSGSVRTMAQDAPGAHFGLGSFPYASEVRVDWPDGLSSRLQGMPAGQVVVVDSGMEGASLRSHPAALLGLVPGPDLDGIEARLQSSWSGPPPDLASEAISHPRVQEVLAYALAIDLANAVEVDQEQTEETFRQRISDFRLPPRLWLDQIAIGRFTMFAEQPELRFDVAQQAISELSAGEESLAVMGSTGIRAWARVFRADSVSEPELGVRDQTVRGYLESGWLTPGMILQRYGELAEDIVSAQSGQVLGPEALREGRDVQPFERVWPVLRVFRVGRREASARLELAAVEGAVRDWTRRNQLQGLLDEAAAGSPGPEGSSLLRRYLSGSSYDIRALATAARSRGLHSRREVAEAVDRCLRETRLDLAIRMLIAQIKVPDSEIDLYISDRKARWTAPARVAGQLLFFKSRQEAERLVAGLESGQTLGTVIQQMQIPPLYVRAARSNERFVLPMHLDLALASRLFGTANAELALATPVGRVSEILSRDDEHYLLVVEERLDPQPLPLAESRALAERELKRLERERLLDFLLYGDES
jgi:hypothetical protein